MHGYQNPVNCENFPNKRPNQCDECETMLIDCIRNCDVDDAQCASSCNRDFAYCESNCEQGNGSPNKQQTTTSFVLDD